MQSNAEIEILTNNQKDLLSAFGKSEISQQFYLTGGTTLSEFYLHHRYSEDLDFFTNEKQNVEQLRKEIVSVFSSLNGTIELVRSLETFIEAHFTTSDGEIIKLDFAFDTPFRHQEKIFNITYGIWLDNLLDIACNKISALFDRAMIKDFVDVYFLLNEKFSFDELWEQAKQKHIGLDEYWFCQALLRINQFQQLPRMVKQVTIEEIKSYFITLYDNVLKKITL
ncbi:MAG: nucleotidyl transferase AbiEii/AbiGii toxin family protein [Ignavibacteria bacterium]|nr:nucleotidyl transferase AbiEii/AbiGii toxin family protein [Ignavibacteria bacterium]